VPTLTIVVENESPPYDLYYEKPFIKVKDKAMHNLTQAIRESKEKPGFVLYIGEENPVQSMKDMIASGDFYNSTQKFLCDMYKDKIPVEVGAFGVKDRLRNNQKSDSIIR
jgi:hypothetical protein